MVTYGNCCQAGLCLRLATRRWLELIIYSKDQVTYKARYPSRRPALGGRRTLKWTGLHGTASVLRFDEKSKGTPIHSESKAYMRRATPTPLTDARLR